MGRAKRWRKCRSRTLELGCASYNKKKKRVFRAKPKLRSMAESLTRAL